MTEPNRDQPAMRPYKYLLLGVFCGILGMLPDRIGWGWSFAVVFGILAAVGIIQLARGARSRKEPHSA